MNLDSRVIAAVSTAVNYYLQAEQETLMAGQQEFRTPAQPFVATGPYGLAGRAAAMEVRWMWQMRVPR